MELTLTGASLNSDGAKQVSKSDVKVGTSHGHGHDHSTGHAHGQPQPHSHSHSHGEKKCCSNHDSGGCGANTKANANAANFQTVESIPKEKLLSNPAVLFSALVTCVKGGTFDTFRYLVDLVLAHEKETNSHLPWGVSIYKSHCDNSKADNSHKPAQGLKSAAVVCVPAEHQCQSSLGRRAPDGHTLAHWAAKRSDDIRFLQYLAEHVRCIHFNTKSADSVGMTPLHWAATEGTIKVANFILKHLESNRHLYSTSTTSSTTALHAPEITLAQSLTPQHGLTVPKSNGSSHPINTRDNSGCTPLLIAAQYGHADLAAFLIKRGADPHAVDDSNDTALHWAAYKGTVPVCGMLIHLNGIEGHLDLVDSFGQSPFHLASLRGNVDVVNYFLQQADAYKYVTQDGGPNRGALDSALILDRQQESSRGRKSFPAHLLTLTDKDGKTPLGLAIKKKKPQVESILIQAMDKHCTSHRSTTETIVKNLKLFFNPRSWLSWIGFVSENGQPPKFIFWFVVINLTLATTYEAVVYMSINLNMLGMSHSMGATAEDHGRLWEYTKLHFATMLAMVMTWFSLIMVHVTDPGILESNNYASSNALSSATSPLDGCMEATCTTRARTCTNSSASTIFNSILCLNENKRIRREMHTLTNDLKNLYEETLESYASMDSDHSLLTSKDDRDDPFEKYSLCHSCNIVKPHRSKHCRVLNRCVLLFDHHCPFVGNTIGLYNYKYFYMFVTSMSVAEILFCITGISYLKHAPDGTGREFGKIAILVYFSLFAFMSFGLTLYHTQLMIKNLTTNEHQNLPRYKYLKDENGRYSNPYDRGCMANFKSRFFPGKDAYTLSDLTDPKGKRDVLMVQSGMDMDVELGTTSVSNKKDEDEKISLVQNVV